MPVPVEIEIPLRVIHRAELPRPRGFSFPQRIALAVSLVETASKPTGQRPPVEFFLMSDVDARLPVPIAQFSYGQDGIGINRRFLSAGDIIRDIRRIPWRQHTHVLIVQGTLVVPVEADGRITAADFAAVAEAEELV